MIKFEANVTEEIPANRLVVLTVRGKENPDEINIRLAEKGEVPDFVSTGALGEGSNVTVTINNKVAWNVEAAEDIRAGVSVGVTDEGKLVEALKEENKPSVGYSLNSAKTGEIVTYVRNVK